MADNKIVYTSPMDGLEVLSCSNDHCFSGHLHEGYVLWLNSEAGEKFSLKGNSDILMPGSISIIEPETIHANSPCSSSRRHLRSFYFSEKFVRKLNQKILGKEDFNSPFFNRILTDRRLWSGFASLHESLLGRNSELAVETIVLSSFSLFYGYDLGPDSLANKVVEDKRIALITEYLHANIGRSFNLTELAELAGCTEFHLIRIFRSHKGLPPHSFLIQLRLEKARLLLKQGEAIASAALMSGFSDQSHLTRLFKVRFGLTPRKYQKTCVR